MDNVQKRWWDIWSALLLLFALWATALRLEMTGWTGYLNRVELLVTLGYFIGVMLGASVFHKTVVRWLALAYSMFFLPWQLATIIGGEPSWVLRVITVLERSLDSLNLFLLNRPAPDTTLFLLIMCSLFWALGLTGGYMLVRYGKPWIPLILTGMTLFAIDFNDPALASSHSFTGLFVLFSLLLMGRLHYLRSQRTWMDEGVAVEFDTAFTINRSMIIGGLLLVVAAWNIPVVYASLSPGTPANQEFMERWNRFRDRASNAFAGLETSVVYVYDSYQTTMSLGTGTGLGERLLFRVTPSSRPDRFHFYWRGYSYDFYDGNEWSNTIEGNGVIRPDEWPLAYPEYEGRKQVDFEFQLFNVGIRPVYVPPTLIGLDQQVRYVVDEIGDGYVDLIGVVADPSIRPQTAFQAQSLIAVPTVNQLREAGTEYPDWIDRYLQLPEDMPDSIRQLAQQVVSEEKNPYYQVQLITQYLRDSIEYQEVIDEPPPDVDVIEWFLFDYRKGFCNYYATAEILMLRSLGIPARIAVGFAEGVFQEEENFYEVREKESHAWPEVFFPGIGWVEFEPTASLPMQERVEILQTDDNERSSSEPFFPDNRPIMDIEAIEELYGRPGEDSMFMDETLPPDARNSYLIWVILIMGVVTTTLWLLIKRYPVWFSEPIPLKVERGLHVVGLKPPKILWLWARHMELHPMERMFSHLAWMLRLIRNQPNIGTTPTERVAFLISVVPEAHGPANVLLDQYQLAVYSPHPFNLTQARKAYMELWRLVSIAATRRIVKWLPG
jgi:transglutaminase-like putative cysteine protease